MPTTEAIVADAVEHRDETGARLDGIDAAISGIEMMLMLAGDDHVDDIRRAAFTLASVVHDLVKVALMYRQAVLDLHDGVV